MKPKLLFFDWTLCLGAIPDWWCFFSPIRWDTKCVVMVTWGCNYGQCFLAETFSKWHHLDHHIAPCYPAVVQCWGFHRWPVLVWSIRLGQWSWLRGRLGWVSAAEELFNIHYNLSEFRWIVHRNSRLDLKMSSSDSSSFLWRLQW